MCPRPLSCHLVAHGWQGRSRWFQGWACPCLGDHYPAYHMIRKLIARVLQDLEAVCRASECQSLAQPTMFLKQEDSCLGCLLRSGRPHNWLLCQRSSLSLSSGSTDSKTLDYQRTNPRGYQIVRTHIKETTGIQDPASSNHHQHPVQDASSKQQTKQKYKPNHQQTGLPPHSALPIRWKTNNQTKIQHKSHPIWC